MGYLLGQLPLPHDAERRRSRTRCRQLLIGYLLDFIGKETQMLKSEPCFRQNTPDVHVNLPAEIAAVKRAKPRSRSMAGYLAYQSSIF